MLSTSAAQAGQQILMDSRHAAPAVIYQYLLPTLELSSKWAARCCCCRSSRDRQTDRHPTVTQTLHRILWGQRQQAADKNETE